MTTHEFPDVSHHNGNVDFAGIRRAGAEVVVIKATEGPSFVDPAFSHNWDAAKRAGLKRSAYCFARTSVAPEAAADRLASLAHDAELPLVCDWEDDRVPADWCRRFLRRLDAKTGRLSIIYTTAAFARAHGGSILTPWPLWVARYRGTTAHQQAAAHDPGSVSPWSTWMWWQFTDRGRVGPHFGDVNRAQSMPMVDDKPADGVKPSDSREKIRFLQVLLQFLGHYHGKLDGVFGTELGQAVRRFKAAHNAVTPAVREAIGAPYTLDESVDRGWIVGPRTLQAIAVWVRFVDQLRRQQ